MGLTMKDRYAALDLSKLPKSYQDEFDEMSKSTYGFTDEDLNDIFAENFNEMYSLVTSKYPDAIKKGGTLKKTKSGKKKVVKPKVPAAMRKKLSQQDIIFVEDQLTNDELSDDDEMVAHFVKETGMSEAQAKKWVALRDKYLKRMSPEESLDYPTRTKRKKEARKAKGVHIPAAMRKKLTPSEIERIEDMLANKKLSDEEIFDKLETGFGLTHFQAKKWVALREKYQSSPKGAYVTRTAEKKRARKGEDLVNTRDGKEFDRKNKKNIGKKFFDENGKQWECVGYNAKLDECIFKDKDGKEISSCLKDMYTSNPVAKREKGNLVDECKETLKEAGYTVKEHKAGTKKITRSEPRPEKVIIKERVEESFTPIMKDLRGSDEKEKENKAIIDILEEIQGSFTKFMNRISNLADDKKLDALKKIKKLLDEIID